MKKLFLSIATCSLFFSSYTACGKHYDQSKESVYKLLFQFPPLLKAYTNDPRVTKTILEQLRNKYALSELLPHVCTLIPEDYHATKKIADQTVLVELYRLSQTNPDLRPFFKQAYNRVKKDDALPLNAKLPDQATINSYPDCFSTCTSKEIILEPLLTNKKKLTRKEYAAQVANHDKALGENVKFFGRNLSEVLFPGLAHVLLTLSSYVPDIDTLVTEKAINESRTPNKKRDRAILENFWNESLSEPYLLPFIEQGYTNFIEAYDEKPSLEGIMLKKKSCTLGDYCKKNSKSPQAQLYAKLSGAKKSVNLMRVLMAGAAGLGIYLGYSYYRAYRSDAEAVPPKQAL